MGKVYILQPSCDHFYLEEFYYESYQERYEKTKDVNPRFIFEESELDLAIDKLILANRD